MTSTNNISEVTRPAHAAGWAPTLPQLCLLQSKANDTGIERVANAIIRQAATGNHSNEVSTQAYTKCTVISTGSFRRGTFLYSTSIVY